MYIKKVEITNIRCIDHFEMTFDHPAGWHVLIGDNGSGKSSIVRSISLSLIGNEQVLGLGRRSQWTDWNNWLKKDEKKGEILIDIIRDPKHDKLHYNYHSNNKDGINSFVRIWPNLLDHLENRYGLLFENKNYPNSVEIYPSSYDAPSVNTEEFNQHPINWSWNSSAGWFSVSYGPNRKFTGVEENKDSINSKYAQLIAHITLFDESASLMDSITWLKLKKFEQLEDKNQHFETIKELINNSNFLPYKAKLSEVSSDKVIFIDGNGLEILIDELSDGFRSMIGLFMELIRQIFARYFNAFLREEIFSKNNEGEIFVNVPGVVLIDEIDAHLHPTWQTRIGQWFTKYFPNIQFIVTTHSPLICRACEKGSIWRLAAPGSEMESGEITGLQKDRLIYGNILDAYGTEVFGKSPVRSAQSNEKLARLGELSMLSALGKITDEEEKERIYLQKILSTDDPTGF